MSDSLVQLCVIKVAIPIKTENYQTVILLENIIFVVFLIEIYIDKSMLFVKFLEFYTSDFRSQEMPMKIKSL